LVVTSALKSPTRTLRKEWKLHYLTEPTDTDLKIGNPKSARTMRRAQIEVYVHRMEAAARLAEAKRDCYLAEVATIRFLATELRRLLGDSQGDRTGSDSIAVNPGEEGESNAIPA
jgi:hypothetical protein